MKKIKKQVYLIVSLLILVNALLFASKTVFKKAAPKKSTELPDYRDDFGQRFDQAKIQIANSESGYGLLVFLVETSLLKPEKVIEELLIFQKMKVAIELIVQNRLADEIKRLPEEVFQKLNVVIDSTGDRFRSFGVPEKTSCLIFYQQGSPTVFFNSIVVKNETDFRNSVESLSKHPFLQQRENPIINEKELSPLARKMMSFPFDSLIDNAKNIEIDLDKLPQKRLVLKKVIGGSENPAPGELFFAQPIDLAADSHNRVFVCDSRENTVFVLNKSGGLMQRLGGRGKGPGEFISPFAIYMDNENRVFVADGNFKIQVFDDHLKYVDNCIIGEILQFISGFCCLDQNILFIPELPKPPRQQNLIGVYAFGSNKLTSLTSFFHYHKPQKNYSNQTAVIATQNAMKFTSNGWDLVTFYHISELSLYIIDLKFVRSYKVRLTGNYIKKLINKKLSEYAPNYAKPIYIWDIAFARNKFFYLFPDGIIQLDLADLNSLNNSIFLKFKLEKPSAEYAFNSLAVTEQYFYLGSTIYANLTLFEIEQ